MQYSAWQIVKNGFRGGKNWKPLWHSKEPKKSYDIIIIGGGGHGLATAYYLAKNHALKNIAVIEKGYLGGGNVGRNTTIVRANYLLDGNSQFFSHSLKLWESMEQELNFNTMMSQRGILSLGHSDGQMDSLVRRGNMMISQGDDAELLSAKELSDYVPYVNQTDPRFPIYGGLLHRRGGTARHDAVAWGYARAADRLGVDIIQNCEVTGMIVNNNTVLGVQTTKGKLKAD